jgi:glutamyl-tRNA synthetase
MVLVKSDGFPTYHLAHIIDDHLMEISHTMRAIEWFPSFPLHVQIWQAFGWDMPIHAHLPVMLNPNGKGKMSKRNPPRDKHGNIIPVMVHDYINAGYLPEAMTNFLANIGWNFGDEREYFTMAEAIERFDLARINPANSAFPVEKLEWLNGEHIRALPTEELARRLRPILEKAGYQVNEDLLVKVTPLVQTRLKRLNDVIDMAGFFFRDEFKPVAPEELVQEKMDVTTTRDVLSRAYEALSSVPDFSHATQEEAIRSLAEHMDIKPKHLFGTLRVAVTGQKVSTPLFETMEILGREVTLERIRLAGESFMVQS